MSGTVNYNINQREEAESTMASPDTMMSLNQLGDFCQENDIAYLGLFGSYARGDEGTESDVDLLVRFSKAKSLLDHVRIERRLADILGKRVDLVTVASLSPYLRDRILAEVKVVFEESGQ